MTSRLTLSGRYELSAPIGRGGMGEVFSGYDMRLDRPVAVKLLRTEALPTGVDQEAFAKRFVRESRLTARVEHPGVPAVFDAGADQGRLYLVMQLVPGTDLADFLTQRQPLPVETAVAVAAQISSILTTAHAASLVHRDLKPRNVVIRPDGTAVVLDFGVAALLDADVTKLTGTGEMLGSPAYMSPEQAVGGKAGTRSDLYALGCILHELLASTRPFSAENSFATIRMHVDEPPPPLRTLRPDTPAAIEALVLDLLAKDPADRPPDAAAVYERLHPFLPTPERGDPHGELDPTRPYRRPHAPRPATSNSRSGPTDVPDVDQTREQAIELAEAGRFTQAANLLHQLLGHKDLGVPAPQVRGVRLQLANTSLLGGDYARALPEYLRLIDEVVPDRGEDDPDVLNWHVQVALCQDALGRPGEALAELEPVLARKRGLDPADPEVVELRRQVALLRASCGDIARARAELADMIDDLGAGHIATGELRELMHKLDRHRP